MNSFSSLSPARKAAAIASAALLVLGLWIAIASPMLSKMHAAAAYKAATAAAEASTAGLADVRTEISKRTIYADTYIAQVNAKIEPVDGELANAQALLEQADSANKPSDKSSLAAKATEEIKSANMAIASAREILKYTDTAYASAAAELAAADSQIARDASHIAQLAQTSGFNIALKDASAGQADAAGVLAAAHQAAAAEVNGKHDLPLAYSKAQVAEKESSKASALADAQVTLAVQNAARIASLTSVKQSLLPRVGEPVLILSTLRNYHAASSWGAYKDYDAAIASDYKAADQYLSQAMLKNSITVQDFSAAKLLIDSAQGSFNNANTKLQQLAAFRDELEQYRSGWPALSERARTTVNDQVDSINSYGSYDSGAVDEYNRGKDEYDRAVAYANEDDYASAWQSAQNAINAADGTGDQAYQAYKRHLARSTTTYTNFGTADGGTAYGGGNTNNDTGGGFGGFGGGDTGGGDGGDFGGGNTGGGDGGDFGGGGDTGGGDGGDF